MPTFRQLTNFPADEVIKENATGNGFESKPFDGYGVHTSGELITNDIFVDSTPVQLSSQKTALSSVLVESRPTVSSVSLPLLQTVSGGVTIFLCDILETIDFPVMTSCGPLEIDSNPLLDSMGFASLSTCGTMDLSGLGSLAAIDLPALLSAESFNITSNTALTSLTMPQLTSLYGTGFSGINGHSLLASLSFPQLTSCSSSFQMRQNSGLVTFSAPALITCGNGSSSFFIIGNSALTAFALPALTTLNGFISIGSNAALTSIGFPALVTQLSGAFSISVNNSLTSIDISALSSVPADNPTLNISDNPSLSTISLNPAASLSSSPLLLFFQNNALPTAQVDTILAIVDGWGRSNGLLQLSGGTNGVPTGGTSNPNLLSLVSRGWSVSVNS